MIRRFALMLVTCLPPAGLAGRVIAAEQPATQPARPAFRVFITEVVKLDEKSITLVPVGGPARQDRTPVTYGIDKDTRVYVGQFAGERKTPSGQVIRSFRVEPATLADLKVGQQVRIDPDGDRAARITLMPPPSPPPEKDPPAEKNPPAEKKP